MVLNDAVAPPIVMDGNQSALSFTRACLQRLRGQERLAVWPVVEQLLSVLDGGQTEGVAGMAATGIVLSLQRGEGSRREWAGRLWQLIRPHPGDSEPQPDCSGTSTLCSGTLTLCTGTHTPCTGTPTLCTDCDSSHECRHQHRQIRLLLALVRQPKCPLLLEHVPFSPVEGRSLRRQQDEEEEVPLVLALSSCLLGLVERRQVYQLLLDFLLCLTATEAVRGVVERYHLLVQESVLAPALFLVMTGWTAPGADSCPEQLRSCLAQLMAVARLAGAEARLEERLVQQVQPLSWGSAPRLHVMAGLGRHAGPRRLLWLFPRLLEGLVQALAGNHLLHVAAELFGLVAETVSDQRLTGLMLRAIDVSGTDESPVRRRAISTHWLPVLVIRRHSVALALLDHLLLAGGADYRRSLSDVTIRVRVCAGLCLLHELIVSQHHFPAGDVRLASLQRLLLSGDGGLISVCLSSWWPECRSAALQVICSMAVLATKSPPHPPVPDPCVSPPSYPDCLPAEWSEQRRRVWQALSAVLSTECLLTRHMMTSQLRRLLLLALKPPRDSSDPPSPGSFDLPLSSSMSGLLALVADVCALLSPDANYASVKNCLLVVQRAVPVLYTACSQGGKPEPLARRLAGRLLLLCMSASSEEIGARAGTLWLQLRGWSCGGEAAVGEALMLQLREMSLRLAAVADPRRSLCAANLSRLLTALTRGSSGEVVELLSPHLAVCRRLLGFSADSPDLQPTTTAAVDISRPLHGHIACLRVISCEVGNCSVGSNSSDNIITVSSQRHLLLECVHTVCSIIDATLLSLSHWSDKDGSDGADQSGVQEDYTSPSFADIGHRLDSLAAAVSEGTASECDPSSLSTASVQRRLLAHYWLNLKECCRYVSEFADAHVAGAGSCEVCRMEWASRGQSGVISTHSAGNDGHSRSCLLSPLPRMLLCVRRVLTNCRHKGAIEAAKLAWLRLCSAVASVTVRESRLDESECWSLHVLPELERVVCLVERVQVEGEEDECQRRACSLTRRGAGLPMLLVGVLSTRWRGQQSLLDATVSRLLAVARRAPPLDGSCCDLAQTDAVYMLQAVVAAGLACDLQAVALSALDGLACPLWPVRNASAVLFSTLLPRLLGQKKSRTCTQLNSCSAAEFFGRWPCLLTPLTRCVSAVAEQGNSAETSNSPLSAAVLTLISRLSPPGPSHCLREPLRRLLLSCRRWATRRLSARALSALLTSDECEKELARGLSLLQGRFGDSENMLHGLLVLAETSLAETSPAETSLVETSPAETSLTDASLAVSPRPSLSRTVAGICWRVVGSVRQGLACPPVTALALQVIRAHPDVAKSLPSRATELERTDDGLSALSAVVVDILRVLLREVHTASSSLAEGKFGDHLLYARAPYSEQILRACVRLAMDDPESRDLLLQLLQHVHSQLTRSLVLHEAMTSWLGLQQASRADLRLSVEWVLLCCRCVSDYCLGRCSAAEEVSVFLHVCAVHWQCQAVGGMRAYLLELWRDGDGGCTERLRPALLPPLVQLSLAPLSSHSALYTIACGPQVGRDRELFLSLLDRVTGALLVWSSSEHADVEFRLAAASSVRHMWAVLGVLCPDTGISSPAANGYVASFDVFSMLFRAGVRVLAACVCFLTDEEFDVRERVRVSLAGAGLACDSGSSEPPLLRRWSAFLRRCLLSWQACRGGDTDSAMIDGLHAYLDSALIGLMLPSPLPATLLSAAWAGLAGPHQLTCNTYAAGITLGAPYDISNPAVGNQPDRSNTDSQYPVPVLADRLDEYGAYRCDRSLCMSSAAVCFSASAADRTGVSGVPADLDHCLRSSLFAACGREEPPSVLPPVYRQQLSLARVCAAGLSRAALLTPGRAVRRCCLLHGALLSYWQQGLWLQQLQQVQDTPLLLDLLLWEGVYSVLGCFRLLLHQFLDLQHHPGGPCQTGCVSCLSAGCRPMCSESAALWRQSASALDGLLERCPLLPKWLS